MDPDEVWVFTCSVTLEQNHDNTACVTGQPGSWDGDVFYPNDENPVEDCDRDSVIVVEGGRISAQAAPCSGPQSTIAGIRFIGLLALLHVRIDDVPVVPDVDGDVAVTPGLHSWEVRASNDVTVLASGDVTVPTCQEGGTGGSTGTPAASLPNSAVSSTSAGTPLAALAFGLLLLSSLGALAFVNVRSRLGAARQRGLTSRKRRDASRAASSFPASKSGPIAAIGTGWGSPCWCARAPHPENGTAPDHSGPLRTGLRNSCRRY